MSWIRKWTKSKRHLSWRYITRACDNITTQIRDNNQTPDHIIALARGGLIPGTIMANMLDIRHVYSVGLSSYHVEPDGTQTQHQFDVYQQLSNECTRVKRGEHVLIVDDISDKGTTFEHVIQLMNHMHQVKITTAAIMMKPATKHVPTHCHETVNNNKWVVFPWEKQ